MDRNFQATTLNRYDVTVALRKESVDRNNPSTPTSQTNSRSLSARRAWIEIIRPPPQVKPIRVALRKESVDRNRVPNWLKVTEAVALRKESVDRNSVSIDF